jgi:hypothetical protein
MGWIRVKSSQPFGAFGVFGLALSRFVGLNARLLGQDASKPIAAGYVQTTGAPNDSAHRWRGNLNVAPLFWGGTCQAQQVAEKRPQMMSF